MRTKLCCLLSPEYRCIGCDVPICIVCAGPDGITDNHKLSKCPATYYSYWLYDNKGHAFNDPDSLEHNRIDEANAKREIEQPMLRS